MKALLNLLRSMRFAIAILTVVAVAATTGSVLEQSQPAVVYVSRYGEFWATFFRLCGLTDVYHVWWFFVLLAFMASSTALCLWQNIPSMLRDMRAYRENKSLASLRGLEHHIEFNLGTEKAPQAGLASYLTSQGFKYKHTFIAGGSMLAARTGSARRLGYLLVHGAMVLICVGGLIDGNVFLRLRLWTGDVKVETRDLATDQVPAASKLDATEGSYRASMTIPQGEEAHTALIQMGEGYLQQELPFAVRLKQFRIDHYANGQPKDFASDIEIIDGEQVVPATLQVNHPYTYRGVTLFQSGFADGGSKVKLGMLPSKGSSVQQQIISGTIGHGTPLLIDGEPATLEFTELRAINVFNKDDVGDKNWSSRGKPGDRTRDVGPSIAFRIRDKLGQSDEWLVYQRAVEIDSAKYRLIGRQHAQEDDMRYLRIPTSANGSLAAYTRLINAMGDPQSRARVAKEVAVKVVNVRLASTLEKTSEALMAGFYSKGYRALVDMVQTNGDSEQELKVGQLYLQLLERSASLLLAQDAETTPRFVHDALSAYNDTLEMQLPALFAFESFEQVNATGLQVTHAPGAALVYLGAALLAMGVIAMYFVRERRIWLHTQGGNLLLAFSANRHTPALQTEFDRHTDAIAQLLCGSHVSLIPNRHL
ncbi:cytochrome c biogenesis protein ResB [Duganella sp. LjRoot269]|uniref:cytochrome c biogenesis protein ResB n=1 Tax=Duganella sp. LjRoot269 TaxID=3342305 RepID=UPI003ECE7403